MSVLFVGVYVLFVHVRQRGVQYHPASTQGEIITPQVEEEREKLRLSDKSIETDAVSINMKAEGSKQRNEQGGQRGVHRRY